MTQTAARKALHLKSVVVYFTYMNNTIN